MLHPIQCLFLFDTWCGQDFDPQAEKLEKMAEEEEKLRKEGMAAESKRQEDVIKGLDTSKERQRLDRYATHTAATDRPPHTLFEQFPQPAR